MSASTCRPGVLTQQPEQIPLPLPAPPWAGIECRFTAVDTREQKEQQTDRGRHSATRQITALFCSAGPPGTGQGRLALGNTEPNSTPELPVPSPPWRVTQISVGCCGRGPSHLLRSPEDPWLNQSTHRHLDHRVAAFSPDVAFGHARPIALGCVTGCLTWVFSLGSCTRTG